MKYSIERTKTVRR